MPGHSICSRCEEMMVLSMSSLKAVASKKIRTAQRCYTLQLAAKLYKRDTKLGLANNVCHGVTITFCWLAIVLASSIPGNVNLGGLREEWLLARSRCVSTCEVGLIVFRTIQTLCQLQLTRNIPGGLWAVWNLTNTCWRSLQAKQPYKKSALSGQWSVNG